MDRINNQFKGSRFFFVVWTLGILLLQKATAHPGHGQDNGRSIWHYLAEPEHIIPVLTLSVAVIVVGTFLLRRKQTALKSAKIQERSAHDRRGKRG